MAEARLRREEGVKHSLRAAGFRATPARAALLELLGKARRPLRVEEVCAGLRGSKPDQATVYRALKELWAKGLVRRIDFEHGHAHYEIAREEDHHHLVCVRCGAVEDVAGCGVPAFARAALRKSAKFKTVLRHSLELFGICQTCEKK